MAKELSRGIWLGRPPSGSWDALINDYLSPGEKRGYQNDLDAGNYKTARRWLGTALHNAVAADLEENYPSRFTYTSNRLPDYLDHETGIRVELTTRLGFLGHWARGGEYRGAVYVLYRGPGTLPSAGIGEGGIGEEGGD